MEDTGKQIRRITELLAIWFAKIRLNTALSYYDINKAAEDLVVDILNILYDYELFNLNDKYPNFPVLDIGDENIGIGFQVTSSIDTEKIYSTIQAYLNENIDNKFPKLRFFILNHNEIKFGKNISDTIGKFYLTRDEHSQLIQDYKDEIKKIQNKIQALT